jgi:hypothetical protein
LPAATLWYYGPFDSSGLLQKYGYARLKVSVRSAVAVDSAFIPAQWLEDFKQRPDLLSANLTHRNVLCASGSTLAAERECSLLDAGNVYFLVFDKRPAPNALNGFIAGGMTTLGIKGPLQEMTATNNVRVDIAAWTCVANCNASTKQ